MAETARQLTGEAIIEEVLTKYPATAEVFLRWRMHCIGCPIARFESITDACKIYQRPVERFLAELEVAAKMGDHREACQA